MNNTIKNQIKKFVKINGSHSGIVKLKIKNLYPEVNIDEYSDFIKKQFELKYNKTKTSIKSNIRYQ